MNNLDSLRKRSSILNMLRTSLNRILHKDLHLHSYKIPMVQELKAQDHAHRLQFAREVRQLQQHFFLRQASFSPKWAFEQTKQQVLE